VNAPLLSNWWYRVAARKPKLRSHARLHRHIYRGEVWYLLQDPASSRVHRFSPSARLIVSLMDGTHSVEQLWELANRHLGEDSPSQDELIHLLGQLHAADLLESDVTPDVAELFTRSEREQRARHLRSYGNPMAIRIPLFDPDRLLNRWAGLVRFVWSGWGALAWLAFVLPAFILIWPHWPELSHNFSDRVLAIDNLFIIYLVFPAIKALHELGHASATKAGGGEVHDLGIILRSCCRFPTSMHRPPPFSGQSIGARLSVPPAWASSSSSRRSRSIYGSWSSRVWCERSCSMSC